LTDVSFKIDNENSLTELSELRLEVDEHDQQFGLVCLLRFATMHYQHKDREYEVGVSRAVLRLNLEGCETTLDNAFGENTLAIVEEYEAAEAETAASASGSLGLQFRGTIDGSAAISGDANNKMTRKRERSKAYLPVVARPNNCWEVKPVTVIGTAVSNIDGTAIPSERLCLLRRKKGGNRMSIIAEVQVSKSAINVAAKRGNKVGKRLAEYQNKDAIISQILKRAIQREAATNYAGKINSVVAISRCEIAEE
jgi:hypothetical protein